ncbi:prepilin-type N-terminal cleavage/methylation domain-containing protein [Candidatus Berkelbacteria bacterium]|nr:prepilin-type N-terminal cleavage/methylation domain-containing protein [Candidatus Berkelbacteria bacterium]
MQKRGFTLIEVLIAAGILFMVAGAVAGLTNTIIQGTSQTADNTETNRWASEGLELVTKVRNDNVASGGVLVNSEKVWFAPAVSSDEYGWYSVSSTSATKTSLQKRLTFDGLTAQESQLTGAVITSTSGLTGYRLICIEAYGAKSYTSEDFVDCNAEVEGAETYADKKDGNRLQGYSDCDSADNYCIASKESLNKNKPTGVSDYFVLPGNVVRVRSVIIWEDRGEWKTTEMSTLLTNWKGFEQN